MVTSSPRTTISPEAGRVLRPQSDGVGIVLKVEAHETSGALVVVEHPMEPHAGVFPHLHTREDEISYVLEGTVGVRLGAEVTMVPSGHYVLKPRGIPHAFWNAGDGPAKILEIIAPPGLERYFEELATVKDPREAGALGARYGLTYLPEWVPQLMSSNGVRFPASQQKAAEDVLREGRSS